MFYCLPQGKSNGVPRGRRVSSKVDGRVRTLWELVSCHTDDGVPLAWRLESEGKNLHHANHPDSEHRLGHWIGYLSVNDGSVRAYMCACAVSMYVCGGGRVHRCG